MTTPSSRYKTTESCQPLQLPGLGGGGHRSSPGGDRGGPGACGPQPGRGGLCPLGPVRPQACPDGRLRVTWPRGRERVRSAWNKEAQGIGCPGQAGQGNLALGRPGLEPGSKSGDNQSQVEQYYPGPGLQHFGLPAGTREVQPRFGFSHQTRKILVLPRLMRRFVKVCNHNGEGVCRLRERRCAYQDRRHVRPPPPRRKGGGPSDGICVTPRDGNRRSILLQPRPASPPGRPGAALG